MMNRLPFFKRKEKPEIVKDLPPLLLESPDSYLKDENEALRGDLQRLREKHDLLKEEYADGLSQGEALQKSTDAKIQGLDAEVTKWKKEAASLLAQKEKVVQDHVRQLSAITKERDEWKKKHDEKPSFEQQYQRAKDLLDDAKANARAWESSHKKGEVSLKTAMARLEHLQKQMDAIKLSQTKLEGEPSNAAILDNLLDYLKNEGEEVNYHHMQSLIRRLTVDNLHKRKLMEANDAYDLGERSVDDQERYLQLISSVRNTTEFGGDVNLPPANPIEPEEEQKPADEEKSKATEGKPKAKQDNQEAILELLEEISLPQAEISRKLGISRSLVSHYIKKLKKERDIRVSAKGIVSIVK